MIERESMTLKIPSPVGKEIKNNNGIKQFKVYVRPPKRATSQNQIKRDNDPQIQIPATPRRTRKERKKVKIQPGIRLVKK